MPFTTRPSFTSRQGMILLASIRQCLLDLNQSFVKSLADDYAVQPPMIKFREMLDVGDRRDASRCDHGEFCVLQHFLCCFDVRTFENAVTRDIGVNNKTSSQVLKSSGECDCPHSRIFGPASHLNIAVQSVDAYGDIVRILC